MFLPFINGPRLGPVRGTCLPRDGGCAVRTTGADGPLSPRTGEAMARASAASWRLPPDSRARPGPVRRPFGHLPARKRITVASGGGWSVTIGAGIALIIIGAILKWGVTWKPANLDLGAIGIILMVGGVAVVIVAIVFMMRRSRRTA